MDEVPNQSSPEADDESLANTHDIEESYSDSDSDEDDNNEPEDEGIEEEQTYGNQNKQPPKKKQLKTQLT